MNFNYFFLKFFLWLLLLYVGIIGLTDVPITSCVFIGLMIAHGIELQHQTIHRLGFPNEKLNNAAGFLLGSLLFVSFREYQINHLHHHKHAGTLENREQFDYASESLISTFKSVILYSNLKRFFMDLFRKRHVIFTPYDFAAVKKQKLFILCLHTLILSLLIVKFDFSGIYYYLLTLLIASIAHYLIELPEHFGCMAVGSTFENTRTVRSNIIMFWYTNGNNYHVEHHLKAWITPEECIRLHKEIKHQLIYFDSGYLSFYLKNIKKFVSMIKRF